MCIWRKLRALIIVACLAVFSSSSEAFSFIRLTPNSDSCVTRRASAADIEIVPEGVIEKHEINKSAVKEQNAEDVIYSHTFWGEARTKDDIQAFCENALRLGPQYNLNNMVQVLHEEPPLIYISNFLSQTQCETLVQAAASDGSNGFRRSTTGATQETSEIRTSTTTWLRDDEGSLETTADVLRYLASQVSALVGLPPSHQENLQMIQYTSEQKFDLHTDHLNSFNDFHFGGRLATCLIYLNSSSEIDKNNRQSKVRTYHATFTGGETYFPQLGISVEPTQGSALLFWNTLERPGMDGYSADMFLNVDDQLSHSGRPVKTGIKWACNRWIHPVDYGAGVRGI